MRSVIQILFAVPFYVNICGYCIRFKYSFPFLVSLMVIVHVFKYPLVTKLYEPCPTMIPGRSNITQHTILTQQGMSVCVESLFGTHTLP